MNSNNITNHDAQESTEGCNQTHKEYLQNSYSLFMDQESMDFWNSIRNLDEAPSLKIDWHTTHTFHLLLHSLNLNPNHTETEEELAREELRIQNHSSSLKEADRKSLDSEIDGRVSSLAIKDPQIDDSKQCTDATNTQRHQPIETETILSAEALKILSELPNVSFMSHQKSFFFPK